MVDVEEYKDFTISRRKYTSITADATSHCTDRIGRGV